MDSNRKYLNPRKLWTIRGTTWKWSPTISALRQILEEERFNDLEAILISCGCNDMDRKDGLDVFNEMVETILMVRRMYPFIKIIISEVTPRNDERDSEVILCNERLNERVTQMENVVIINHSNLRDENMSMFSDAKHIKENDIKVYAGNIKTGLRKAFGITKKSYLNRNSPDSYENNRNVSQRDTFTTNNRSRNEELNSTRNRNARFQQMAGYNSENEYDSNNNNGNKMLIHRAVEALSALLR